MRRGFAITIVYLGLLLIPIGIGALIVPPLVDAGQQPDPEPARVRAGRAGLREQATQRLRRLEEDYNITEKLQAAGREAARADR